jgi:hypothetical protein
MENIQKELEDRQGRRIAATLGIVILFLVIGMVLSTALTSAPADESKKGVYLRIDEVFFLLEGKGTDKISIGVTAFISNIGSEGAENVEIVAFVIEKNSNLALDQTTYTVGSIEKEKTKIAEFSLAMPDDDSYTIKLILMESGRISIRGSGNVNLNSHSGGSGTRFATDSGTRSGEYEEDSMGMSIGASESSFPVWLLLGGLLALILLVSVLKKASSRGTSEDVLSYDLPTEIEVGEDYPAVPGTPDLNAQIINEDDDELTEHLNHQPLSSLE